MGARDKLNGVVVGACLIVSALLGAAMESWGAFWGIFLIMVICCSGAVGIEGQRHLAEAAALPPPVPHAPAWDCR